MSENPLSQPDDARPADVGGDDNESNSMFDHFLVFGSFGALISLDALLLLIGEWLFGPLPLLVMGAFGVAVLFVLIPVWWRVMHWIDKAAAEADPDRTALIRTPTILQNGYERLQGSWIGRALLLVVMVGLPLLAITRIRDFFSLFEQPLWGLVCVGLFPLAVMLAETVIALVAGLVYGGPDEPIESEDTRRETND